MAMKKTLFSALDAFAAACVGGELGLAGWALWHWKALWTWHVMVGSTQWGAGDLFNGACYVTGVWLGWSAAWSMRVFSDPPAPLGKRFIRMALAGTMLAVPALDQAAISASNGAASPSKAHAPMEHPAPWRSFGP